MSPAERAHLLDALSPLQSEVVQLRLGLAIEAGAFALDRPRAALLRGNADNPSATVGAAASAACRGELPRRPMSLEQVAHRLRLTRTQVRRCELDAFARLRQLTVATPDPTPSK